ncbi:MAG: HAD family phosphatase [Deltaproteobacteria bacterium]|nr:HAD family phosphatase [Deltaproteobacteria bacterium]
MTNIECKLAAIDLDGTLLDRQYQLSDENSQAVQELAATGVIIVLASGRMHATILPFSQKMRLTDPIISYNGAMVKQLKTGEVLHHIPIPNSLSSEIITRCDKHKLHLNFYLDDLLYVCERNKWSELYDSRTGATSHPMGDLHQFDGHEPTKLQIVNAPERIDRLLIEFQNQFQGRLYITKTQPEYLEFMNPSVSKGRALHAIAKQLDVPDTHTVAFGDGYNDISLMESAGFCIAMGNSVDEIKKRADYITDTNDEDGIASAIRSLLL